MNNLTGRSELATKIAKRTGIFRKDCFRMIDALIEEMNASIKAGDGLLLQKLGKFEYYVRGQTRRRVPETGEWLPVPPATRVKFTPNFDVKYGVVALDWEPYLSDAQKDSDWYKKIVADREIDSGCDVEECGGDDVQEC